MRDFELKEESSVQIKNKHKDYKFVSSVIRDVSSYEFSFANYISELLTQDVLVGKLDISSFEEKHSVCFKVVEHYKVLIDAILLNYVDLHLGHDENAEIHPFLLEYLKEQGYNLEFGPKK